MRRCEVLHGLKVEPGSHRATPTRPAGLRLQELVRLPGQGREKSQPTCGAAAVADLRDKYSAVAGFQTRVVSSGYRHDSIC